MLPSKSFTVLGLTFKSWIHSELIFVYDVRYWSTFFLFSFLFFFFFACQFSFSCSVMSDSVTPWTAARQASLSISNSQSLLKLIPLSQWCHPTISSSDIPFSSCLQCFPASGSFLGSQFFASGGQSIGVSASASGLPMNIQDWFPLRWTGLISLQSKGLSRVFSNTTVQNWYSSVLSFLYSPTPTFIYDYWKSHSFDKMELCWQSNISTF